MFNSAGIGGTQFRPGRPRRMQRRPAAGLSLIEMVVFIVVISVCLVGVVSTLSLIGRNSGSPAIQRQSLALAESLMAEIELQPFTTCDPLGPPLTVGGSCQISQGLGAESGESRYSTTTPFNNVGDYHNFTMSSAAGTLKTLDGSILGTLPGYSASVTVQGNQALGALPGADVLLVTVAVTGPDNSVISLSGYRTRNPQ